MMNPVRFGHPHSVASGFPCNRNRERPSSSFGPTTKCARSSRMVLLSFLPSTTEKCGTDKFDDRVAQNKLGAAAEGDLAARSGVRLVARQCSSIGSGQCFHRRARGAAERTTHPGQRSTHYHVSPRGMGSPLALWTGKFYLPVPSCVYLALSRY